MMYASRFFTFIQCTLVEMTEEKENKTARMRLRKDMQVKRVIKRVCLRRKYKAENDMLSI